VCEWLANEGGSGGGNEDETAVWIGRALGEGGIRMGPGRDSVRVNIRGMTGERAFE
jgi:hypothetical protein